MSAAKLSAKGSDSTGQVLVTTLSITMCNACITAPTPSTRDAHLLPSGEYSRRARSTKNNVAAVE